MYFQARKNLSYEPLSEKGDILQTVVDIIGVGIGVHGGQGGDGGVDRGVDADTCKTMENVGSIPSNVTLTSASITGQPNGCSSGDLAWVHVSSLNNGGNAHFLMVLVLVV